MPPLTSLDLIAEVELQIQEWEKQHDSLAGVLVSLGVDPVGANTYLSSVEPGQVGPFAAGLAMGTVLAGVRS
jgi:hypothetical protein